MAVALNQHAAQNEVVRVKETGFGPRYEVDGELAAPDGRRPRVCTVWQMDEGEAAPRLITAYPLSAQIRLERNAYYDILERTQKETLDITAWLDWFIGRLDRALDATETTLAVVLRKARFWERRAGLAINERQRLVLNKLLDGFEGRLTSSKWAKLTKCSQDTAHRDIQDLINQNILVKDPAGGRSTSYSLTESDK